MKKLPQYPTHLARKDLKDNQAYSQAWEMATEQAKKDMEKYKKEVEDARKLQEKAIDTIIEELESEKAKVHLKAGYQAIELRISELLEQARTIKTNIILPQK